VTELSNYEFSPLREGNLPIHRGRRDGLSPILVVALQERSASDESVKRLEHEYSLRAELDIAWAARPVALTRYRDRLSLVLDDPGGEPLERLCGRPWDILEFLHLAIPLAHTLGRVHDRGLVHKDIKPANILVDVASGGVWLTGFGVATRAQRERPVPDPPEVIAGTLAYMAPEQTGRMNRSTDSRSDLYGLGVTLYEMLTGALPFTASDAMELIHSHIAQQPVAPSDRVKAIPAQLSAIALKLLAKTAEERYQTAAGLEADLRRCLALYESYGRIDPFPLGARDVPDRLVIPERLYGREGAIEALRAAFDRVAAEGRTGVVFVSGDSGAGKSSVVNELQKALISSQGRFATGKFDQYMRDIPYATLAQAFQSLVRSLLGQSEAELRPWRDALREALGPNGQLIVNLVPELEVVIGRQHPVTDLSPRDAQRRFQMVIRRFLGVFAGDGHPLALFLDDLQWLDTATLELFEHLATHAEVRGVLLIGAYRAGEVGLSHPLSRSIAAIGKANRDVCEIALASLSLEAIGQLVGDALHCQPQRARPLARLLHDKTAGNPFFAVQFLTSLVEEGLLVFDSATSAWRWDIDRIRAKGYSDNVVDLIVGKLGRLSRPAQNALNQLACLGTAAEVSALALVHGQTVEVMDATLGEAVNAGLIARPNGAVSFLHDRIQQAAYSLIPDERRPQVHLHIGRALLASLTPEELGEQLFDVASQFNRAADQRLDGPEKVQVATLNLQAGRKAKASAAYAEASTYLAAGASLLGQDGWDNQYDLLFQLQLERAECAFLRSHFDEAEQWIGELIERGASRRDQATAYFLKAQLHVVKSEYGLAATSALTCLNSFGIVIPPRPTWEQVVAEYDELWSNMEGRPIESLLDLPLMTDPDLLAALHLLSNVFDATSFSDFNLSLLHRCRMVNLSLRHGVSGASAAAFGFLGTSLGPVFGRYSDAYRFAKVGCDLVDKHGFASDKSKVHQAMSIVAQWTQPTGTALEFARTPSRTLTEAGDFTAACYSHLIVVAIRLFRSDPLEAVWRESETGLDFVRSAGFSDVAEMIVSQQRFIAAMRGLTATFSTFDDAQFNEEAFETGLTGRRVPGYWNIVKLKTRFLSGDYADALGAAEKAKALLPLRLGQAPLILDYFVFAALTVAALYGGASDDVQAEWRDLLETHRAQLQVWAEVNPPSFVDKHALVAAEIARVEGRDADAMRLYELAIQSAHEHQFVQSEGLAQEVAARFYASRGFETIAQAYLRGARRCYSRWGAEGKVRQLEQLHPHLRGEPIPFPSGATVGAPVGQLDIETVIKASQALYGEILLGDLIHNLMRITLEHAGAERGLLILFRGGELKIEAEAITRHERVEVSLRDLGIATSELPLSMLHYVVRTREGVVLDDASVANLYSEDDYVRKKSVKSVLCLPIGSQANLVGALYLENNLTSHAFTADRVAVLKMLASQAAISLENARLYADLHQEYTDRKNAEEALLRAQADLAHASRVNLMGELTAALAHEVNQPITAAVANANACLRFLSAETPDLEEARDAAAAIVKAGVRAAEIVSRTRELFKKGIPKREPVDLNSIIRETVILLESEAGRHAIPIRTRLLWGLPEVTGDRIQLQQVIMNLMMNSMDAMKDIDGPRELIVSSRRTGDGKAAVAVSDTGSGLPTQGEDRIFDAFFTTKQHGTGMGLSISRSIVEAHGGRLWAAPNSPRGTTLEFAVPLGG
jgi:predicted ATPase/signal transduction histidine kinase